MTHASALLRSLLHNVGVVAVGFGVALLGRGLDALLGLTRLSAPWLPALAWPLLTIGFLLRVWATFHFYVHAMRVISLTPQGDLLTSGPYRFTRNPLYLGGNVFVFLGTTLLLGTPSGLALTVLHWPLMDAFVRREERQLERTFGDDWVRYRERVRRWL